MKNLKLILPIFVLLIILFSCATQKTRLNNSQNKKDSINKSSITIPQEKLKSVQKDKDVYKEDDYLHYSDFEYNDKIKTVNLFRDGFELSEPLIQLNTADKLKLEFDDLDGDVKTYKYYYIHCDADWKPSVINNYEFETGFNDDFITEYKYSYNTLQRYTHYHLIFPNDNITLTVSGNYLLVVYIQGNKKNIVLTRRFRIFSPVLEINATIKPATDMKEMRNKQEIDFSVDANSYPIGDPYTDLKVIIMQNGRTDNQLYGIKPQEVSGEMINYNVNGEITFNGGNEFRRFDIRSLQNYGEGIRSIKTDSASGKYYVTLHKDTRRNSEPYLTDEDIDGRFLIKDYDNATDSKIEGDYVYVHFTLPFNAPLTNGNLYILGALTNWRYGRENNMKYNSHRQAYECTLYLKQGYYNYEYVFIPNDYNKGDETLIEGNHSETENEYTIFVYCREMGTTFDGLLGVRQLTSVSY